MLHVPIELPEGWQLCVHTVVATTVPRCVHTDTTQLLKTHKQKVATTKVFVATYN